jgi:hypothetical protein
MSEASIAQQLDADPEFWEPTPGAKIIGVLTAIEEDVGQFGAFAVYALDTTDGPVAVRAQHKALKSQLDELRPQVGDSVGIKFKGNRESASGNEYRDYKVVVERASDSPPLVVTLTQPSPSVSVDDDIPF